MKMIDQLKNIHTYINPKSKEKNESFEGEVQNIDSKMPIIFSRVDQEFDSNRPQFREEATLINY